jgi:hypothetical protein
VAAGTANIQAYVGSVHLTEWVLTINAATVTLTNVSITSQGGVTSIGVGGTNQLQAICTYSDGTTTSCNTTDPHGNFVTAWTSSSPPSATVSTTGVVTGLATGLSNLTGTAGGHTSAALPLAVSVIPSGNYTITIKGPVTITGTVHF